MGSEGSVTGKIKMKGKRPKAMHRIEMGLFCEVLRVIGSWRLGFLKMDLGFFWCMYLWERASELESVLFFVLFFLFFFYFFVMNPIHCVRYVFKNKVKNWVATSILILFRYDVAIHLIRVILCCEQSCALMIMVIKRFGIDCCCICIKNPHLLPVT